MKNLIICYLPLILIITLKANNYQIGYNLSKSIDKTIFLYKKDNSYRPNRNDLIIFKVKKDDPYFANENFIKYVSALFNDKITFNDNSYIINSKDIFIAKEIGTKGQKLDHFKLKDKNNLIPQDNYFVTTNHPDSYDSRYFDYVNQNQIIGYVIASI